MIHIEESGDVIYLPPVISLILQDHPLLAGAKPPSLIYPQVYQQILWINAHFLWITYSLAGIIHKICG